MIVVIPLAGTGQRLFKGDQIDLLRRTGRDMHYFTAP